MYKYYVYVRPGYIEYFDNLPDAQEFAHSYDAEVKEMNCNNFHSHAHQDRRAGRTIACTLSK